MVIKRLSRLIKDESIQMKIHCVGDSWTNGFSIEDKNDTWPFILAKNLDCQVEVTAFDGADNESIFNACMTVSGHDLLIVGWSGVSRIIDKSLPYYKQFSLSYVPDEDTPKRHEWFNNHSLDDILDIWEHQISQVEKNHKHVLMYSTFGDRLKVEHSSMLTTSFLEYLGSKFEYEIPIYEFDFLHENNKLTHDFASKYFSNDWERACVERENLRNTENFLNCGHPTIVGHRHWAEYLTNIIKEKYDFE